MNVKKIGAALSDQDAKLKGTVRAKVKTKRATSNPDIYVTMKTRTGKKTMLPCEFFGVGGITRIDGADYVFVKVKPKAHRDFSVTVCLTCLVRLSWFGTPEKQAEGTAFDPEIFEGDPPLDTVNTHALDIDNKLDDNRYPVTFKADVLLDILERHGVFKQAEEKRLL